MNAIDRTELNGRIVLVCSAQDHRNPPTGRRGTLCVHDSAAGQVVEVEVEFPQMFTTPAHIRRARLTDAEVAQMLASERDGTFTVILNERLDPLSAAGNE